MSSGLIVLIFIVAPILIGRYGCSHFEKNEMKPTGSTGRTKEKLYNLPVNDEVEAKKHASDWLKSKLQLVNGIKNGEIYSLNSFC